MPTATESIFVRHLLTRPGLVATQHNVRITTRAGLIETIDAAPEHDVVGNHGGSLLAIPGIANAHDHARGVRYFSYGGRDAPLECWVPSVYVQPDLDPYVNAALAFARYARSGISAVLNFHIVNQGEAFESELRAAARAANDVGIRLALVVPLRDRNPLAYGQDDALLSLLSPADREAVVRVWRKPALSAEQQVARVQRLAEDCEGPLVRVQFGPIGVQWCSDRLLELVAEESARTGRHVHMHLLETRYQREWMDGQYPAGVIDFLDRIGLLSARLSVAHGVWLTEPEIETLAEREVTVVLNTSSNLRLRSGIAPARQMVAARVPIAFGVDSLALDEDDDALSELRLAHALHNGPGLRTDLSTAALFEAAMGRGARVVTGQSNHGLLSATAPADIALLDYAAMSHDVINGLADETDVLLVRGTSRYVRSLVVAGRRIVADGTVRGVDERAVEREALQQLQKSAARILQLQPLLKRYQTALATFYTDGWHMR